MRGLNQAGVKWVSRVSETSTESKKVLQEGSKQWHSSEDGSVQWYNRIMSLPQGTERWAIVRTEASQQRAQQSLQRQVSRAHADWEQKCWHLGHRRFACEADARAVLERERIPAPWWLVALTLCLFVEYQSSYNSWWRSKAKRKKVIPYHGMILPTS